jgi:uncharacterized protein (TIGR02444 family)
LALALDCRDEQARAMNDTTSQGPPSQGSPFWRFSLQFYRLPQVADACIALQEEAGVDVNLLLFLLWQARERRRVTTAEVAAIEDRIAPWRTATVIPLRNVRRVLKSPPPGLVAPASAEAFRNRIKAVELEAERLQQEAMFALAPVGEDAASAEEAARANIAALEDMLRVEFPRAAVDTLLTAFARMPSSA